MLTPTTAPAVTPRPDGSDARFVTLPDGRQMFLNCIGSGAPAVIFDSGAGSTSSAWHGVWQETGKSTLACTYDRAGLGLSDPGPLPRDTTAVANDIDALLTAAKIPGPYILVGHSLGSYHIRQFANTRFDKMAGMVLVDPSGDGQEARFMAAIPKAFASSKAQMDAMKSLNCVDNLRAKLVAEGRQARAGLPRQRRRHHRELSLRSRCHGRRQHGPVDQVPPAVGRDAPHRPHARRL